MRCPFRVLLLMNRLGMGFCKSADYIYVQSLMDLLTRVWEFSAISLFWLLNTNDNVRVTSLHRLPPFPGKENDDPR
jgi:hypothetical protein